MNLSTARSEKRAKEVGVRKAVGTLRSQLIQFAKNRPVNYRKEGLITVNGGTPDLPKYQDAIRNDLLATGVVDNMAGAGVGALVITLITVSFQAIKAALANPVKSLRTD